MRLLKRLYPFIRPYRRGYLLGLLLVVVANVFGVLTPHLVGRAIDVIESGSPPMEEIARYAGLILAVALLGGVARYGMRELMNGYSRRIETDLRDRFFEHLMRLDAAFFDRWRTGDLMSRATNDILSVRMAVGPAVMYTVNTIVLGGLTLVFMISVSLRLTVLALIPMIALPPLTMHFGKLIHRKYEAIQAHLGTLTTMVQENLAGARIVRAYTREPEQEEEFAALNREYLRRNVDLVVSTGAFYPSLSFMAGLGMLVVLYVGGRLVISQTITIGSFVAFGFYLSMMIWPMISLGWVVNLYQRGSASLNRVLAVLDIEPEIREPEIREPEIRAPEIRAPEIRTPEIRMPARTAEPDPVRGAIEFRDVRFSYPGAGREVLSEVSFSIPAGATAALVGPTGSGKSTIVALVARLYDPTGGTILLDGVPLSELPLDTVRAAIGLVPQDAFLFSETIAENIALGLERNERDDIMGPVRAAARIAQLEEAIGGFPHGYETRLGERGINLSGGQRQRTTLARALARDPRILILDDALSAVDTQTERRILHGLKDVLAERTSLIISHRVTAVMDADLILVLEEGRIAERGTHTELIRNGGIYANLLRRQLLEEDIEKDRDEPSPDAVAAPA